MGNWQMEVARMFLYISFPIGIFHFTNYNEDIDDWLKQKREKHLPYNKEQHMEILHFMQSMNNENQMKHLKMIEEQYQKTKEKHVTEV